MQRSSWEGSLAPGVGSGQAYTPAQYTASIPVAAIVQPSLAIGSASSERALVEWPKDTISLRGTEMYHGGGAHAQPAAVMPTHGQPALRMVRACAAPP